MLVCKADEKIIGEVSEWITKTYPEAEVMQFSDIDTMQQWALSSEPKNRNTLTVRKRGELININIPDIISVESKGRIAEIITNAGSVNYYKKLGEIEKLLPKQFVRCHQSYIVNMDYVKLIRKKTIYLVNGKTIPVSRNRYDETKKRMETYYEAFAKSRKISERQFMKIEDYMMLYQISEEEAVEMKNRIDKMIKVAEASEKQHSNCHDINDS